MMNTQHKMPVIFVGHGSPMNAIEDNRFSQEWHSLTSHIPKPKAILSISAHWVTAGHCVNNQEHPKTVYDMYGFPQELYEVKYTPFGSPDLANQVLDLLGDKTKVDNSWGIDHGTWSVLNHVFPEADVPVIQLSIDANATMEEHFETGKKLRGLREQGVLILGSGNVVHNLSLIDWDNQGGETWAVEFDGYIKQNILGHNYENVIEYQQAGISSNRAFYTTEHFVPLLVVLGSSNAGDSIKVFNDTCIMGSMSMTGYLFG
jgi:4,5-DOPA dioxygenase extradiol